MTTAATDIASRIATSDPIAPVFVLSLPRAGSTLVQRVLAVHPDVATTSEPWVALPLLSPLCPSLPQGGRWHEGVAGAVRDFAHELPDGLDGYRAVARDAALRLYREVAGPGPRFFLDKSPPYALIADELLAAFPGARVLFLWRHPLAVVASIVETFCGGRWRPDDYAISLFSGLDALVAAHRRHADRTVAVRYEQLVAGGPEPWQATARALDLPFDPAALERFAEVRLDGRFGDPTGVHAYQALARDPLTKWHATIRTPLRRAWCRRYVRWIGHERLTAMGYDLGDLLRELNALEPRRLDRAAARDAAEMARSLTRDAVKARVVRGPRSPSSWRHLLAPR